MDDNTRDRINKIIEKEAPALHNKIIDLLEKNGIQANIITASTLVYIGIVNQLELGFAPSDLKKSIANLIDRLYNAYTEELLEQVPGQSRKKRSLINLGLV